MPSRARRPCSQPRCPRLLAPGERCPDHDQRREQQRAHDQRRGSSTERGYDWRWRAYAKRYLAAHPLCVYCRYQGRLTPSECVDHKTPLSRGGSLWDPHNHAAACLTCNTQKRDRTEAEHLATLRRG